MNELTVALVIVLLAAVAYGVYLAATIKGDGINSRRQPPASHHQDMFDPSRRLA